MGQEGKAETAVSRLSTIVWILSEKKIEKAVGSEILLKVVYEQNLSVMSSFMVDSSVLEEVDSIILFSRCFHLAGEIVFKTLYLHGEIGGVPVSLSLTALQFSKSDLKAREWEVGACLSFSWWMVESKKVKAGESPVASLRQDLPCQYLTFTASLAMTT